MTSADSDSFWHAGRTWRHSLLEGLRIAAIPAITISTVRTLGWLFHTDEEFAPWLWSSARLGLLVGLPLLPIFAVWTRWDVWRGNQLKAK